MSLPMKSLEKPAEKPQNPCFSAGPCAKRPGWNPSVLSRFLAGRSHRSGPAKVQLKDVIEKTRAIHNIPADYRIAIMAASDTGAVETALWNFLGPRGVDVFAWEAFSTDWVTDVTKQLKIDDARVFNAAYGALPDLGQYDPARDAVFVWNGTTSGVKVPNTDWIPDDRQGLTICDAVSAAFCMELPWHKLDVTTFAWQKGLGSEGAHGMIVLSPRAAARLLEHKAQFALPKIFRMTSGGKINEGLFQGETMNTPSMLCVADVLDSLEWAESVGGLPGLIGRVQSNYSAIEKWVDKTSWAEFLAQEKIYRSESSVCLEIVDEDYLELGEEERENFLNNLVKRIEKENAGYDFKNHKAAPASLRIWAGPTVETKDIEMLLQWIEWSFAEEKKSLKK